MIRSERLVGRFKKSRKVTADGRIGNIGQAKFAKQAALLFFRKLAARGEGEKAFESEFESLIAGDLGLEGFHFAGSGDSTLLASPKSDR